MNSAVPMRLGLVGCGWIAGNRLRQIAGDELVDIVALVDPDSAALEAAREWAPQAAAVPAAKELDVGRLDGVMISTPSAMHCAQAGELLDRGVPVFVQKPLGLCAADVERVLERAAARNLPVATDFCYRHLDTAKALAGVLRNDGIGRPFHVEACFHNAYRPGSSWSHDIALAGGGALIDLGIHLLDLVMWLCEEPLSLTNAVLRCRGRPWCEGQVEDFAALDLELQDGARVRLTSSWDASTGKDAEIVLRILGERGTLVLHNRDGSFFHFDARLCRGTHTEALAADDDDSWQAGPLRQWLRSVRDGHGYRLPSWVGNGAALIDQAYAIARAAAVAWEETTATVHVLAGKGVRS